MTGGGAGRDGSPNRSSIFPPGTLSPFNRDKWDVSEKHPYLKDGGHRPPLQKKSAGEWSVGGADPAASLPVRPS